MDGSNNGIRARTENIQTGRIRYALPPAIQQIVFGHGLDLEMVRDLSFLASIDQAHILMLASSKLIEPDTAKELLKTIRGIVYRRFEDFRACMPVRGTYLLWEQRLIELLGENLGGRAHLGRSRNDVNATMIRLKLRRPVRSLLAQAIRLIIALMNRAKRWANYSIGGYTHYRPAMPLTFGHQLLAWAFALSRDVRNILHAASDLRRSPLGAGAQGGTALPIDPAMTAKLLGFDTPAINSLDGVASRDVVLHLLASASVLAVTLSRIATDLLLLSTEEFGFISLPDELVGSSSQMPQKRNPFLLEHVQSRGMSALGAFVTAASSMHATPFTNSVAVGTEAVRPVEAALRDTSDSVFLLRRIIVGMEPRQDRMSVRADNAFLNATALADRIVLSTGMAFRTAHHLVGQIVTEAIERSVTLRHAAAFRLQSEGLNVNLDGLEADALARAANYGGGPGERSLSAQAVEVRKSTAALRRDARITRVSERRGDSLLESQIREFLK